jgi:hypothetical protein
MKITIKDNGYKCEKVQNMITIFNIAVERIFPECEIEHFYYGDALCFTDVILPGGEYGHFNITSNRVSFNGHTCSFLNCKQFERLTYNDELFKGELIKIYDNLK